MLLTNSVHKTARLFILGILLVSMLLIIGCGEKADTGGADKAVPVSAAAAKKDSIAAKTVITGKVTAQAEVIMVPKVGGKVTQVPVDMGTTVKKGQLLVQLDTADLQIALSTARLNHDSAVQNYNNAKANYDRKKTLFAEGAVSQQDLDAAKLQYDTARDTANQSKNGVSIAGNNVANATITSPVDGEVAVRSIDPGEMASPTTPVMTVVNIDKVYIEGTVAESDVAKVTEGQKVTVQVDSAGGAFEGIVKTISPVANAQTKGYPMKVEIVNPGHKLKPGMFAEIQLVTSNKQDAVVIPKSALVTKGADKVLFVVKAGMVEERVVQTGIETDDRVEIVKGLAAGEQFVTEGQQSLTDKTKVTVRNTTGS